MSQMLTRLELNVTLLTTSCNMMKIIMLTSQLTAVPKCGRFRWFDKMINLIRPSENIYLPVRMSVPSLAQASDKSPIYLYL